MERATNPNHTREFLDPIVDRMTMKLEAHYNSLKEMLAEVRSRKDALVSVGYGIEFLNDAITGLQAAVDGIDDAAVCLMDAK
jgi:hypothetical protein